MKYGIPDEIRNSLECTGLTLESIATIDQISPSATILVYFVDLARTEAVPQSVSKFSSKQYAIPRASHLQLATPRYYQGLDGDHNGIRDEMEARYQEDIQTFLARGQNSSFSTMDLKSVRGHVTFGGREFWMFCTTVGTVSSYQLKHMARRFDYDCVTTIRKPSQFARELGATIAIHSSWADVELQTLDTLLLRLHSWEKTINKMVCVYHGSVAYSDNPKAILESLPEHRLGVVVPFIKRRSFAWQNEYRFILRVIGEPREDRFYLPITAALRQLTNIEWENTTLDRYDRSWEPRRNLRDV